MDVSAKEGLNNFSALDQFERRLIQERTQAGLAAAPARGSNGGRQKVTSDEAKVVLAKKRQADKSLEIDDILNKTLPMSRSTFYQYGGCDALCRFSVVS